MFISSLRSLLVCCVLWLSAAPLVKAAPLQQENTTINQLSFSATEAGATPDVVVTATNDHAAHALPPSWLAIPFIVLLLMIASGPLLYAHFWHRHYPKVAVGLALLVTGYYAIVLHDFVRPVEALMEYVQFISLIAALYMASGGILIEVNKQATPLTNLGLLILGAIIANLIGTTGASMLLIRPFIRLNRGRIKVYHIVFFIFMVSNVGGALTPIGDPPLFLGFLSGVPFFWTLQHNFLPWLTVLLLLGVIFYYLDARNASGIKETMAPGQPVVRLQGGHNFVWLALIIVAVFIDPNIFTWVPALYYHGHAYSFVREVMLLSVAGLSYYYANQHALKENAFSLEPLKEVVLIFIGIFGTMVPALQLISAFAGSEAGQAFITHNALYWSTGAFSSVLDNAPTYLNFAAASMAAQGADIGQVASVKAFAAGGAFNNSVLQLKAISVAAVFFGAMTYIGNGPNFMVKAIAEQMGIRMPSFFGYIFRFSVPFLLPALVIVWLLFFAFA